MSPGLARDFWLALVDNATALVDDARILLNAGSVGRAVSLTVLAEEELGKARWVWDEFERDWSAGIGETRTVAALEAFGRLHKKKYYKCYVYGDDLERFWGEQEESWPTDTTLVDEWLKERNDRLDAEAKAAADRANRDKQNGFYVDISGENIITPSQFDDAKDVQQRTARAAQVIEMLLIQDHTRMKFEAQTEYDGRSQEIHWQLLRTAHPKEWADFEQRSGYK